MPITISNIQVSPAKLRSDAKLSCGIPVPMPVILRLAATWLELTERYSGPATDAFKVATRQLLEESEYYPIPTDEESTALGGE